MNNFGIPDQLSYNELRETYPTEVVIYPIDKTEKVRHKIEWDIPLTTVVIIVFLFALFLMVYIPSARDWLLEQLWNAGLMDSFLESKTESINNLMSSLLV